MSTMWDKRLNHMIIIRVYVDYYLTIRNEESVVSLIDNKSNNHEFILKIERDVNQCLSCCIEESKDEGKFTMIQPHFLTHFLQKFGDERKRISLLRA
jgi:hypothetical protein